MIWSQVIRLGFRERPKIQVQTPLLLFFSFHSLHLNNGELKQPLVLFQQTTKVQALHVFQGSLAIIAQRRHGTFSVHDSLASLAISTLIRVSSYTTTSLYSDNQYAHLFIIKCAWHWILLILFGGYSLYQTAI